MPKINNQKKRSFLKKRFDLTNKKVRFFIVIGIFAILGGVYFTYRSFASSTYIILQTGSRGGYDKISNLVTSVGGGNDKDCNFSGALVEPQKNNQSVQGVLCKPVPVPSITGGFCSAASMCGPGLGLNSNSVNKVNYAGKNIQMCAYLKAATSNTKFVFAFHDPKNAVSKWYERDTVAIPTDRYVSVCSDWVRVPKNITSGVMGSVFIKVQKSQPVGGYWGTLTLQSDSPLPSAPATPSK